MTNYCHLSYEERKNIEDGLNSRKSINQISKELHRNHSTILREIDRNKIISTPANWNNYSIPCKNRNKCNKNFCSQTLPCYEKEFCEKLLTSPYVCNGCKSRSGCRKERYTYYARKANDSYKELISNCRSGINLTEEEIFNINNIIIS